ncbi:MAG: hypothetical protein Q4D29_12505 [Lachnospiraceae bacterium]|nr:hypothetical protein [Lachnospiraceae bacterium]
MIVPLILDKTSDKELSYLYDFFAGVRMALDEKCGLVIAQEEYNHDLKFFKNMGRIECDFEYGFPARLLTQEDFDSIRIGYIRDAVFDSIVGDKNYNTSQVARYLLFNRCKKLEKELDRIYEEYIAEFPEKKIDAFLMFRQYKSVDIWAKKKHIDIIYYDWSTYRHPVYNGFVYIDLRGFLQKTEIKRRYYEFSKIKDKVPIFNGLELLALTLNDKYKKNIIDYYKKPVYKCGVTMQNEVALEGLASRSTMKNITVIKALKNEYRNEELCVREDRRDDFKARTVDKSIILDKNEYASQFITDCISVASICSNIAFETKLWGRDAIVASKGLYEFMGNRLYNNMILRRNTEDEAMLSFCTFGFYIPFERLRSINYLKWRLTRPAEEVIYMDNLLYYLRKKGISKKILNDKDRLTKILDEQGFDNISDELKKLRIRRP